MLNSELGDFYSTLRRFARIEDLRSPQGARSLKVPFKSLTNELMLLSNFSKESVWIMFCARRIPCLMPRKIFVVSSFQARGPDRWWLWLSLARKSWADPSLESKAMWRGRGILVLWCYQWVEWRFLAPDIMSLLSLCWLVQNILQCCNLCLIRWKWEMWSSPYFWCY